MNARLCLSLSPFLSLSVAFLLLASAAPSQDITEFMATNGTSIVDEDGEHTDWIEIQNDTGATVNLAGWHLTDDAADLTRWTFPSLSLAPGAHAIVFASRKNRATAGQELHTNFRLNDGGELLALVRPNGQIQRAFNPFPPQYTDISYGVYAGQIQWFQPATPGQPNQAGYAEVVAPLQVFPNHLVFENPQQVTFSVTSTTPGATIVVTTDGSVPTMSGTTITNGMAYTGPISVSSTTLLRAAGFKTGLLATPRIATRTYINLDDAVSTPANPPGWPANWVQNAVGTVPFRSVPACYDVNTAHFTAAQLKQMYRTRPIVSVVMDQEDLTGTWGIYTNPMNETLSASASVELIDPDLNGPEPGFQIGGTIQVSGSGGRDPNVNAKHSFKFDPQGAIDYPIFDTGPRGTHSDIYLNSGFNDSFAKLWQSGNGARGWGGMQSMMWRFMNSVGETTGRVKLAFLFLNGVPWGHTQIFERNDRGHFRTFYDDDILRYDSHAFKHRTGLPVQNSDANLWTQARHGISTYQDFQTWWNEESTIRYLMINFFLGTGDWLNSGGKNNWYAVMKRPTGSGDPLEKMTPKFHDAEIICKPDVDRTTIFDGPGQSSPAGAYALVKSHPLFQKRFGDMFLEYFYYNGRLRPDRMQQTLEDLKQDIRTTIGIEYSRWGFCAPAGTPAYARARTLQDYDVTFDLVLHPSVVPTPTFNTYFNNRMFNANPQWGIEAQFAQAGLRSTVPWVEMSQDGGMVSSAYQLALSNAGGHAIYYTLDGTDPLTETGSLQGGGFGSSAQLYAGPITITGAVQVKARSRTSSGNWSNLRVEGFFTAGTIKLSEYLASNQSGIEDEFGEREDWVEIYNAGPFPIDIGGYHLTDDLSVPNKWMIPAGTTIGGQDELLIWCDGEENEGPLHASFSLSASGEQIGLFAPDGLTMVDADTFGPQQADVSIGRLNFGNIWLAFLDANPVEGNAPQLADSLRYNDEDLLNGGTFTVTGSLTSGNAVTLTASTGAPSAPVVIVLAPTWGNAPLGPMSPDRLLVSSAGPVSVVLFAGGFTNAFGTFSTSALIPPLSFPVQFFAQAAYFSGGVFYATPAAIALADL